MRTIFLSTAFVAIALAGMACADADQTKIAANANITKTPAPDAGHKDEHSDDAPRISLVDAKKDFDGGGAVFIDTRSVDTYKADHIKGALNIAAADLDSKADSIPKGKKIIAYCS